jgi:hypothetical protein
MAKNEITQYKKLKHMYYKQLKAQLIDYQTYLLKLKTLKTKLFKS